jgi:hypothetical protein
MGRRKGVPDGVSPRVDFATSNSVGLFLPTRFPALVRVRSPPRLTRSLPPASVVARHVSYPVVILEGEALTLVNIERQAPAPGGVVKGPPAAPDQGEDDFEGAD